MKKRILLITGDCLESDKPNAQCVSLLVQSMTELVDVTVICINKPITNEKQNFIFKLYTKFKRIVTWPTIDPAVTSKLYKQAKDAIARGKYDAVVGVHKPFSALLVAHRITRKLHGTAKFIIYELDPITNDIDKALGIGRHLFFLSKWQEKRLFYAADHIFHMRCNRNKFDGSEYEAFRQKSSYLDFPLIMRREANGSEHFSHKNEQRCLVYSGLLSSVFRSPDYLLEILDAVSKKIPLRAMFFTKGDCQDLILRYSQSNPAIVYSEYIPKTELDNIIENADCLISITNKLSDMLPSKLIYYISTGKPILHMSNGKNDICVDYLNKYELSLVLNEEINVDENALRLITFLGESRNKRIDIDTICRRFFENTPEFSSSVITQTISRMIDDTSNSNTEH